MSQVNESLDAMADPVGLAAALAAGKKVGPNAIGLLIEDHRKVEAYFRAFESASGPGPRLRIAALICQALRVHMLIEEQLFYPEAQEATGEGELVSRAIKEHAAARELIEEIERAQAADANFDVLVERLQDAIEQHVAEEESELFPAVQAAGADLFELGDGLAILRVEAFSVLTGKPLPD